MKKYHEYVTYYYVLKEIS